MSKGLKITLIVLGIFLAIVIIAGISIFSYVKATYNSMVTLDEDINNKWAQVETQLQRRYDLIPNLVETVKGYASHEKEVLTEVTQARASVGGAKTVDEKMAANNQLAGALSRLLLVVERYPDLKANQNFIQLQDELAGTENRIAVERKRYNDAVSILNAKVRTFPANLVASALNIEQRTYFEAPKEAQEAPKVDFGK